MARVPHVYVPGPWSGPIIDPGPAARHHLSRVLRLEHGDEISYTDGAGIAGRGTLAEAGIARGQETAQPRRDRRLVLGVAAPRQARRARFVVEKLGEIGCDDLVWLETERGESAPPRPEKSEPWAIAALEQSRRVRLLNVSGPVPPARVWEGDHVLFAADPYGRPAFAAASGWTGTAVVLVGPEGGFAPGEVGAEAVPLSLGDGVLRVETAAVVAAALLIAAR